MGARDPGMNDPIVDNTWSCFSLAEPYLLPMPLMKSDFDGITRDVQGWGSCLTEYSSPIVLSRRVGWETSVAI